MQIDAGLTGPLPRSEPLVRATRDLERGRTGATEVDRLYGSVTAEVFDLEARLDLAPWTGGYLRWADLFRPFALGWSGFEVGPVTRWFETNTFYRQPILHAPPEKKPGALASWFPSAEPSVAPERTKAILPGPYTFAGLLDNRSGEAAEALVHRLGRLLAAEAAELRRAGCRTFQFQEPLLVTRPPAGPSAESTRAAYRWIAEAVPDATTIVWTFFGDAAPAVALLGRLPVTGVGVDLSETDPGSLAGLPPGRGVGLGCLDPRTTLVEDPEELAGAVGDVIARLQPSQVWLGPGAPLDLLPWEAALRKLPSLSAARTLLTRGGSVP